MSVPQTSLMSSLGPATSVGEGWESGLLPTSPSPFRGRKTTPSLTWLRAQHGPKECSGRSSSHPLRLSDYPSSMAQPAVLVAPTPDGASPERQRPGGPALSQQLRRLLLLPWRRSAPINSFRFCHWSVCLRGPRVLNTLSGGNSLRTPSSCRLLPRHAAPYPPPGPGSKHSRARAPRRGSEKRAPRRSSRGPGRPG